MADGRKTFSVSLVTPEGAAWEGEAEMIIVPGAAGEIDRDRARAQLEEARAELERIERGESEADRWQLEQRIRHAENQLTVAGGTADQYNNSSGRPIVASPSA